jgi:hypothetical protein
MHDVRRIRAKYRAIRAGLNERTRRLWAGAEAQALGYGGIAAVERATGLSYPTVLKGLREVQSPARNLSAERIRRPGAGRPQAETRMPELRQRLVALVEPVTRGDPESPLRWSAKSTRALSAELRRQGFAVGRTVVADILHAMGYSLQANRKTKEGNRHPDRNAQFEYINAAVVAQWKRRQPAISVDTKKKELVGDFKNGGREWRPQGRPYEVRAHDFMIEGLGKVAPYGVYDLAANIGWVSVGMTHDTAAFAVATIQRWWDRLGRRRYPRARSLLITADSGGSNGTRVRLWKWELQKFADRNGLTVRVHHLPPGTSKWNKIEHRLFSFISQNWRGKPLESHAAIVQLIAATKTATGLKVFCELDKRHYPQGVQVSDAQMKHVQLLPDDFHGDWNYQIRPRRRSLKRQNNISK